MKTNTTRIRVCINPKEEAKILEYVSKPPEVCGNMTVEFLYDNLVFLHSFSENEYESSRGHCVPRAKLGGLGVWHTHPASIGSHASGRDIRTLKEDVYSSIKADFPGFPPISMIISATSRIQDISLYFPIIKLGMNLNQILSFEIHDILDIYSLPSLFEEMIQLNNYFLDRKYLYNFGLITKLQSTRLFGEETIKIQKISPYNLSKESEHYGLFLGSKIPSFYKKLLITHYYIHTNRDSFYLLDERSGFYQIKIYSKDPQIEIIKSRLVAFEIPEYGFSLRLRNLDAIGLELQKLKEKKVTIFGLGFIGTRIVEDISKYIHRINLVDYDLVEKENIGYQNIYEVSDIGKHKILCISEKIEKTNPYIKVRPYVIRVPSFVHESLAGKTSGLDAIIKNSNLIITTFDTIYPRLTIQRIATRYGIPLIDVGVGPNDGQIHIWLPGKGTSCIACHSFETIDLSGSLRQIYSSNPLLAEILSGIATDLAIRILQGSTKIPNRITVALPSYHSGDSKEFELNLNYIQMPKSRECPICNKEIELTLYINEKSRIVIKINGDVPVSDLVDEIRKIFTREANLYILRDNVKNLIDEKILVCQLKLITDRVKGKILVEFPEGDSNAS
ncbi:MAG: ThiF family adenylyltransferase [Candidatus Njordarchaeia archaeon]|nr:ThiF family adenylyltransferase [Candidatus Korarchaeota archaeon]